MYSAVAGLGTSGAVGVLVSLCFHSIPLNREGVQIVARAAIQGMAVVIVNVVAARGVGEIILKMMLPQHKSNQPQINKAKWWSTRGSIGTFATMSVVSSVAAKALLARVGIPITYKEALVNGLLAPVLGLAAMIAVDER